MIEYHYIAISQVCWKASHTILDAIDGVDKVTKHRLPKGSKFNISLWRVPGNKDADYRINNWAPQVQGAVRLFQEDNDRF